MSLEKIGFGGGCHWCTEAVFQSLKGVVEVNQGWIASETPNDNFSEAVIVQFDPEIIDMASLLEIHLMTHSSTSNHSMREKYRSAVYFFSSDQEKECQSILETLNSKSEEEIITQVLPFKEFKLSDEMFHSYYLKNQGKQFCEVHIEPKLQLLMKRFGKRFQPIGH